MMLTLSTVSLNSPIVRAADPHGLISITFDDGVQSQYDYAVPLLEQYGMHATFYVISGRVGAEQYMNYATLLELQADGNEIGSHSVSHINLTQASAAQIVYELNQSKVDLVAHGLTINNFAYPGGFWNATVDTYVSQNYTSGKNYADNLNLMNYPWEYTIVEGFSGETGDDETVLTKLFNAVDQIYDSNKWGVFVFHNVHPDASNTQYEISDADLEAFLVYVASKGIPTVTVNQALNWGQTATLMVSTNLGTVTPTSGLHEYRIDQVITLNATSPENTTDTRYVFNGWTGTGTGSYTGLNATVSLTLVDNITETASWKIQYRLIINSVQDSIPAAGSHWFDSGSLIDTHVATPVFDGLDTRYECSGWSGIGSVPGSGSTSAVSFTISEPSRISWNWQKSATVTSTPSPTQRPTPTVTPTPTPTATPTPTPTQTTINVTKDGGETLALAISGNITASQITNATIQVDSSTEKTTLSFTITGESGTTGSGNITIPKSEVPFGTSPNIYIDDQLAEAQGFTQDSSNYYVWYTVQFSSHNISVVFTAEPPTTDYTPWIIAILIAVVCIVAAGIFLKKRGKK